MARASNGTPEKTRGENSSSVLGRAVAQRVHAIVGQVFDELERRGNARGGRDIVAMIADEVEADGGALTGLERLQKLLPSEPAQAAGALNIGAMFLQATMIANGHAPGGQIIDATPGSVMRAAPDAEW